MSQVIGDSSGFVRGGLAVFQSAGRCGWGVAGSGHGSGVFSEKFAVYLNEHHSGVLNEVTGVLPGVGV